MNATTHGRLRRAAGAGPTRQALAELLSDRRCRRRSTRRGSARSPTSSATASRTMPNRPAVESFGKRMTYAELGRAADAVAVLAAGAGAAEGRPGRDHAAERDGLSGDPVRRPHRPAARWSTSTRSTRRASSPISSTIPARASSSCSRTSRHTVEEALPELEARRGRASSRRAICWASRARSSISSRGT